MLSLLDIFNQEPLLPVYMPVIASPKRQPSMMEEAKLPVDRFLIYAEEGDGTGPTAIPVKR